MAAVQQKNPVFGVQLFTKTLSENQLPCMHLSRILEGHLDKDREEMLAHLKLWAGPDQVVYGRKQRNKKGGDKMGDVTEHSQIINMLLRLWDSLQLLPLFPLFFYSFSNSGSASRSPPPAILSYKWFFHLFFFALEYKCQMTYMPPLPENQFCYPGWNGNSFLKCDFIIRYSLSLLLIYYAQL